MYICIYICIYVYMYIYVYICIYVYRETLSSKYTLYKNATRLKTLLNVFLCRKKLMRGSLRNHQNVHITKLEKITQIQS